MTDAAAVTPEMRKQDRRRARRRAVRHWLRCQWGRTGYRPTMRLLHRLNLCWMEPTPLRSGDNGQWINVWCGWCGVRGKRLDMTRAVTPSQADRQPHSDAMGTSAQKGTPDLAAPGSDNAAGVAGTTGPTS